MMRFSRARYNPDVPDVFIDMSPCGLVWKSKVDLNLITNEDVKKDFKEAIDCFSHGYYNASMVLARRSIHQEMIKRKLDTTHPNNLFQQLENSGISEKLKELLKKVKNFGNYGAHPDYCLFDENGGRLQNEREFAELALNFLDKYFSDEYETDSMIASAPKSKEELKIQAKP